jgi:hypothetical protein
MKIRYEDGTKSPGFRYWLAKLIWPEVESTYKAMLGYIDRNDALTKSNKELMEEMRTGHLVSLSQLTEFTRITQEHAKLNDQQNAIVVFLRDNFPGVGDGKYAGMQFSEMVVAIIRECQIQTYQDPKLFPFKQD